MELYICDGTLYENPRGGTDPIPVEWPDDAEEFVVPEGVEMICNSLFFNNSDLVRITLPTTLKRIGASAFGNCENLEQVTFLKPDGIEEIQSKAFSSCPKLADQDGFVIVGKQLFGYYGTAGELTIPDGIERIESNVFSWNETLRSVRLPISLNRICDYAFNGCKALSEIRFPEGKEVEIGEHTFSDCGMLADRNGMIIINGIMFGYTGSDTTVMVPEGVTVIGENAFARTKTVNVTLPKSLRKVGNGAFSWCAELKTVTCNSSSIEWGRDVFMECGKFADENGFRIIDGVLLKYMKNGEEVSVPQSVIKIADDAFSSTSALIRVTLPDGLREIGDNAFSYCHHLKELNLPDSLEKMGSCVFSGCDDLKSLVLPEHVQLSGTTFGSSIDCLRFPAGMLESVLEDIQGSYKTMRLDLTENGQIVRSMIASTGQFDAKALAPLDAETCESYDKLLASGKALNHRLNEDGRILGMLWRMEDKENPVKPDILEQFKLFLQEKQNKAINLVLKEGKPDMVRSLIRAGVITSENMKKIQKKLMASESAELAEAGKNLEELISHQEEEIPAEPEAPMSPDEKFCRDWMNKNKGFAILTQNGFDEFPEVQLADGSGPAPSVLAGFVVAALMLYNGDRENIIEADRIAQKLDQASFRQAFDTMYEKSDRKRRAALSKPMFRFAEWPEIRKVLSEFKGTWYEDQTMSSLVMCDMREAMLMADKRGSLASYAAARGMTEQGMRDTVLSDVGLNEKNEKTYDLGNQTVTVRMLPDFSFIFELSDGKTAKSIPKKGADAEKYEAASKDFADVKKSVKKIIKNRSDLLFEEFLSAKKTSAGDWQASYTKNPLLRHVAGLLVWMQGKNTFIMSEDGPVTVDGKTYELKDDAVFLAHPMEMKAPEVAAWQSYFVEKQMKQPFEQIWEPVRKPAEIAGDRYATCRIPFYRFMNQEKNGIFVDGMGGDPDLIEIRFSGMDSTIERLDWERHRIEPQHCFEVQKISFKKYTRMVNHIIAYLDRITVYDRVRLDDLTVIERLDSFTLAQILQFIDIASDAAATNVLPALLDYRNSHYPDYADYGDLTLDI